MKKIVGIITLLVSNLAFACPDGQHEECILPRLFAGGCAQSVCAPNLVPSTSRTINICGQALAVNVLFADVCVASMGTSVAACTAASATANVEPFSNGACAAAVSSAALSCSISVASVISIVQNCLSGQN